MRGDIVFRVYGLHQGREKDSYFGTFRTKEQALAKITELRTREVNGGNWSSHHHNLGFVVREAVVETDFEIPSQPMPREKYCVKAAPQPDRPGKWYSLIVEVFRRGATPGSLQLICDYGRNHALFQTFEPFRQAGQDYALISRDYTRTAVLDLASGSIVAEEIESDASTQGFCPVGFYVPDWWDVHDGSVIPGSQCWTADHEWPTGTFGFVWGCIWGDDSSWKIQYLDLSRIQEGIISRDERFGYLELATSAYQSPCLTLEPTASSHSSSPHFIDLSRRKGTTKITFSVEMDFDLASGKSTQWQRLRNADFE